jgi:hypothetical protein
MKNNTSAEGPLVPGEVGEIVADDEDEVPFHVRTHSGATWWYAAAALQAAPGEGAAGLSSPSSPIDVAKLSAESLAMAHRPFTFHGDTVRNAVLGSSRLTAKRTEGFHSIVFSNEAIDSSVMGSTWASRALSWGPDHRVACALTVL